MAKAPQKKVPARKSGGSTLVGIFIGLVLGVVLCAGVIWYINGSSLPLHVRDSAPAQPGATAEPAPLPGKPGDKASVKPRLDFYETLPGGQPAAQQQPAEAAAPAPAAPAEHEPAAADASLLLQVGAFSSEEEADNLRARLALMGLESGVQKHAVAGKGTLYRVRIGPFASVEDMKKVRSELAQNGIEASVVR